MAFSASGIFVQPFIGLLDGTIGYGASVGLDVNAASAMKAALYDNATVAVTSATAFDDTAEKSRYGGTAAYFGTLGSASGGNTNGQVYTAGAEWPVGGIVMTAVTTTVNAAGTGVLKFTAGNTATTAATATMSAIRGVFIYGDLVTVAGWSKMGLCAITFGADYSVTNGSFTIQWNASGIFTLDLA
jgi:hypothetical protein